MPRVERSYFLNPGSTPTYDSLSFVSICLATLGWVKWEGQYFLPSFLPSSWASASEWNSDNPSSSGRGPRHLYPHVPPPGSSQGHTKCTWNQHFQDP
jgi:hypothetical protein